MLFQGILKDLRGIDFSLQSCGIEPCGESYCVADRSVYLCYPDEGHINIDQIVMFRPGNDSVYCENEYELPDGYTIESLH